MTENIKLIYDLIQKDLKAQGWDDEAIAEAIVEAQRERQAISADDKTICVKEMSYLSQESIIKIAEQMNNKKTKTNIFTRFKNWIVNLVKNYWNLNWEAKIGILFLIPPIIGAIYFILNLLGADIGFDYFPQSWNCIYDSDYNYGNDFAATGENWAYGYAYGWAYGYAATPAIPLYLGLMAIAGAYLIKGNLNNKD